MTGAQAQRTAAYVPGPAWRIAALIGLAAALAGLTAAGPTLHLAYGGWALMGIFAAGGAGIWLALHLADKADERTALLVILGGALAMRLVLLLAEPYLSTDIYRYVWDGRVQAAGINPYRHMPAAPELAYLRDTAIFPHINRPDTAVTIYPPAAQAIFLAITRLLGESVVAMKVGLIAFEALTVTALVGALRRLGRPPTRVAIYAWHPLAVWEIAGSGHIDAAMCALLIAGFLLFLRGRTLSAGVVVTLGALIKPTALLALPVLWRPWSWRLPLVVALTVAVAYLPYLSVGTGVLGYLGGYVKEEGFDSGRGFALLWLMESYTGYLPAAVYVYATIAAAIMIGLALAVSFRGSRSAETAASCLSWLLAVFLVLASPHHAWYFLPLVPMLALYPLAAGWVLTLGTPLLYDSAVGTGWLASDVRLALFTFAPVAALAFDAWRLRRTSLNPNAGETYERAPEQARERGGGRPAAVS